MRPARAAPRRDEPGTLRHAGFFLVLRRSERTRGIRVSTRWRWLRAEDAWHLLESRHAVAWRTYAGRDSRQCLASQPRRLRRRGAAGEVRSALHGDAPL